MTKTEYLQLKAEVISFVSNNSRYSKLFVEIKNLFVSEIGSRRRQEHITTIEELIKVLEQRDSLSEDNVIAFRKIVNKFPENGSITASISSYEQAFAKNALRKTDVNNSASSTKVALQTVPNDNLKSVSQRKKDLIYETIKQELGKYWMELGRNLDIREHKLNEINSKFSNTYDKASDLLENYEAKADPSRWFDKLCEALEESKRKDLKKGIQNIMLMND